MAPSSSPTKRLRVYAALTLLLGLIIAALPGLAYTGSNYGWYDGPNCGWDGANEHWDFGPPYDTSSTGGATGIQYGYPDQCTRSRLKIRWKPSWGGAFTDVYESGLSGVHSGSLPGAEVLYWTDHDVLRNGTWYGFRLYH